MTRHLILPTIAFSLFVFSACEPDLRLPEIVKEGERVKIGTDIGVEICEGTIAKLDSFVTAVEEALQISTRKGKVGVYVIKDEDWLEELCPNETHSCYIPKERGGPAAVVNAASYFDDVYHEIVHDLHYNSEIGCPPDFLAEGIAAAWGSDGTAPTTNSSLDDLLAAFDNESVIKGHVLQAARFVRYLTEKYSVQIFKKWAQRLSWSDKASKIKSSFKDVFGISIDEEWDLFDDGEAFPRFSRCIAPLVPWQDEYRWQTVFDSDCSSPNVQTNFASPQTRLTQVVVDIPEDQEYFADYSIEPEEEEDAVLYLGCDVSNTSTLNMYLDSYFLIPLDKTKYLIAKNLEVASDEFALTIRKSPEPAYCDAWTQNCAEDEKCQILETWPYLRVDCALLAETPLQEGETCDPSTYPDGDECDMGLECTELSMTCESLCEDAEGNTLCDQSETCVELADDHPGVCLSACNPLADACGEGQSCKYWEGSIFCVNWEDDSEYGDECFFYADCGKGLICVEEEGAVPGCSSECCTAFCDPDAEHSDESCPDYESGQLCVPLADGYGYCTAAQSSE